MNGVHDSAVDLQCSCSYVVFAFDFVGCGNIFIDVCFALNSGSLLLHIQVNPKCCMHGCNLRKSNFLSLACKTCINKIFPEVVYCVEKSSVVYLIFCPKLMLVHFKNQKKTGGMGAVE